MSTCPGSHPKFPGAQDTPQGTRALTQGRLRLPESARGAALPARLAGRPGRAAAHRTPFPFPPFPAFAGIKLPPAQPGLGELWGGAVELGRAGSERRKPPFPSKPPSIVFSRPPSGPSALTSFLYTSGQGTAPPGTLRAPEGPRAPFIPIQLVQNDNDMRARASVRASRTPWCNLRSRVCEGCGFYLVSLSPFGNSEDQEKARERVREENWLPGQLWSLAIDASTPSTIKISPLFDDLPFTPLACPSWLSASLSLVPCLSLLGPWAHTEFPGIFMPSETPPYSLVLPPGPQGLGETQPYASPPSFARPPHPIINCCVDLQD